MDAPSTKVTTAALAGAVVTIVTFLVDVFSNVEITPGVAAALATVFAGVLGFYVKETNPPPSAVEAIRQKIIEGEIAPLTTTIVYPPTGTPGSGWSREVSSESPEARDARKSEEFDPDGGPGPGSVI